VRDAQIASDEVREAVAATELEVGWWGWFARALHCQDPRVTLLANVSGAEEAGSRSLQGSVCAQSRL
jgi:hypothetical protein